MPTEVPDPLSLFVALKRAFAETGKSGVDAQLRYSYTGLIASRNFSKEDLGHQARLADLRYPSEWYPATRQWKRKIHLHVGPTNSGKTHHALKRLEQAKTGLYAGPLRLLAHEVYMRLNAQGKSCDLVTGDERRMQSDANASQMTSCTVEMVPLNTKIDVAVIDEIQMLGDTERGWAWTQALLGVQAKEIHLCGEARTVQLIREIVASIGDELEVHTYERLSPLETMDISLRGNLNNLCKGDCVVVFSRVGIHAMKSQIEKKTGKQVAIIYGSLPPEVRAQQAALFNDPDNDYDILVASDAIGMGLNLAIKRVVFETITKFNGSSVEAMPTAHIKQIAGRAGRYRIAPQPASPGKADDDNASPTAQALLDIPAPASNVGLVTTLETQELPFVQAAMKTEPEPIMTAGILPPSYIVDDFARYFPPSIRFSYVLLRLHEIASLSKSYHLCRQAEQTAIADAIHSIEGLSVYQRYVLCSSPSQLQDPGMTQVLLAYARCMASGSSGELLSIPEIPLDVLDEEVRTDQEYIHRLEILDKSLVLYIWLSYRVAGCFIDQKMAFYVKKLAEEKIQAVLGDFSASPEVTKRIKLRKAEALGRARQKDESESKDQQSESEEQQIDEDRRIHEDLSTLLGETPNNDEDRSGDFEISQVDQVDVAHEEQRPPVSGSMGQ